MPHPTWPPCVPVVDRIRNRALFAVLWRLGLGISEALQFEPRLRPAGRRLASALRQGRQEPHGRHDEQTSVLLGWLDRGRRLSPGVGVLHPGRRAVDSSYVRYLLLAWPARPAWVARARP